MPPRPRKVSSWNFKRHAPSPTMHRSASSKPHIVCSPQQLGSRFSGAFAPLRSQGGAGLKGDRFTSVWMNIQLKLFLIIERVGIVWSCGQPATAELEGNYPVGNFVCCLFVIFHTWLLNFVCFQLNICRWTH